MERLAAIQAMVNNKIIYHVDRPDDHFWLNADGKFYTRDMHGQYTVDFCDMDPSGWNEVLEEVKETPVYAYKMEVYVLDIDRIFGTLGEARAAVEGALDYAHVTKLESASIGVWHDDHPLNKKGCDYARYFNSGHFHKRWVIENKNNKELSYTDFPCPIDTSGRNEKGELMLSPFFSLVARVNDLNK